MTLYLSFISGINRIDTPKFSSLLAQTTWFDSQDYSSIETTFYPPHYQNKIRVSIDDITFTSTCNYLWFEFKNKRYYYFIDNVEYINEQLIEISITMDYIQTYMFDIHVINGVIERKFINRYVMNNQRWIFNRNYIREEVSSKLFENGSKISFLNKYVLIIKSSKSLSSIASSTDSFMNPSYEKIINAIHTPEGVSYVPWHFTIVPLREEITKVSYNNTIYNVFFNGIYDLLNNPNTVDAFLVPEYVIGEYMYTISNDTIVVEDKGNCKPHVIVGDSSLIGPYNILAFEWYERNPTINFVDTADIFDNYDNAVHITDVITRNTSKNISFSTEYLPVLYDENYMYYRIGNINAYVDVPLHYYTTPDILAHYLVDCNSGCLIFTCYSQANYLGLQNIDSDIISYDLRNDAWSNYVANNRNRWTTAGVQAGINAAESFVEIATNSYFVSKGINRVLNDKRSYTKKRMDLKVGAQRHINRMKDDYYKDTISDATSGVAGMIMPLVKQGVEDSNMQKAVDTAKQLGNFASIISRNKQTFYQLFKVRDFEQCGHYFHRNGYKVQEFINRENNIFNYVNNRYYFNILKMGDCELELVNSITSDDTIDGVRSRLLDGLRLWNVEHNDVVMGDFTYDNVENAYLGGD